MVCAVCLEGAPHIYLYGSRPLEITLARLRSSVYNYRPQRSCEGHVFTGVCLSTGGCLPQCMLRYTPPQSRHPPEQTPLPPGGRHCPPEQTHTPGADTPLQSRHPPQSRHPSPQEQTPSPRADTPLGADTHPPPKIRPLLRTVRILLECILVSDVLVRLLTPLEVL